MQGICKFYPETHVLANDHVDFSLEQHEIHAIVGENGAGKTTLMKVLYGLERADEGRIELRDREEIIKSPLDSDRLGIGMVHQHFRLVPGFSVAENVTLGAEPRRFGLFLDRHGSVGAVASVMEEYGFDLDPRSRVADLTVGQKQQVEILKVLYRNDTILILDEPTSVLTEQQSQSLFSTLRYLTSIGRTVIIITHKLAEVKAVSDRVTVMRSGRTVAVRRTENVDERELSRLMVGKDVRFKFTRPNTEPGESVFELENVTVTDRGSHRPCLEEVTLRVREGEIVGVAGVSGNGLGELEETVSGLRSVNSGRLLHRRVDITNRSAFIHRERGLAYVPADRRGRGSSLDSSVLENMIISTHHQFLRFGLFNQKAVREFGQDISTSFSIAAELDAPVGTLSGGNIQKVILARELAALTDFIMFSEPAWGLDIASTEYIYRRILECRQNRVGILLISSNLDEILGLADTLVIMYRGRIVGEFENSGDLSKELIGEYMLGIRDDFKGETTDDGQAANERGDNERNRAGRHSGGGGHVRHYSHHSPK